jgi:hypothetical protein
MVENFLDRPLGGDDSRKERVQSASHIIHIQLTYGEEDKEEVLKDAASINDLLGGYALTVHKFQGSENDRVFLFLHQSHAVMVSRELLYTAVTRAKKFLHIVCETDTFYKGVQSQRIKGDTLLEKAEFFKGKQSDYEEKKAAIVHNPDAVAQPAEYRGAKPATAIVEIEKQEEKVTVPLIKLSELVTAFIKQKAAESLATAWLRATMIWGKDKIGEAPILSFNLTRQTALGLANLRDWCSQAQRALVRSSRDERRRKT